MRTVEQLNEIANPFIRRGNSFTVVSNGKLKLYAPTWICRPGPFATITLNGSRNWFRHRSVPRFLGLGGTDEQTLCQLILWWQGRPRLPGRVLRRWQENNKAFINALDNISYDDAMSTTCVLCGKPPAGLDWWALGGVIGPCCSFGRCNGCRITPIL